MSEERIIQQDRMRFAKNVLSSRLALLAIVLNVLFFVSIYKVNDRTYYTWMMGVSIVYNLVFMLAAFLSSEGVKNYKSRFSILLIILAALQIVRIFIYPATMHGTKLAADLDWSYEKEVVTQIAGQAVSTVQVIENRVMTTFQFVRVISYLAVSAGLLLASAFVNLHKSKTLAAYKATLSAEQA